MKYSLEYRALGHDSDLDSKGIPVESTRLEQSIYRIRKRYGNLKTNESEREAYKFDYGLYIVGTGEPKVSLKAGSIEGLALLAVSISDLPIDPREVVEI